MKIWTEPELRALGERYADEPTTTLAREFGVLPKQLRAKANTMGLTKAGVANHRNTQAHVWTEAEDLRLRRDWPDVVARVPGRSALWLADQLGVSLVQLRHRAAVLGLKILRQKDPPWTDAEVEILERYLHDTPRKIRYQLRRCGYARTETAIVVQRYRKLGGLAMATEGYSATQVAALMGVSKTPVLGWIRRGWLKATPRGETTNAVGGPGDRWIVKPRHLRSFIIHHATLIPARGVNFVWLVDLLAAPD